MINHMIANEIRDQESREAIYEDIRAGRKDVWDGCNEILNNERNASCQRVGFLLGYATAIRMNSDTLTRAQTFFAGDGAHAPATSTAADASGNNHTGTNHDAAVAVTNDVGSPNSSSEVNGIALPNGVHNANALDTTSHLGPTNG